MIKNRLSCQKYFFGSFMCKMHPFPKILSSTLKLKFVKINFIIFLFEVGGCLCLKAVSVPWCNFTIFVGIWPMECQYFVFQLVIQISWSRSTSLTSESGWIFDMTLLIITLVIHDYAPWFFCDYNLFITDVPISQLHLFVTLHLIHTFYII